MSSCNLFQKIKSVFCSEKVVKLSSFLNPETLRFGFLMRPATSVQLSQMLNAYIKAIKTDCPNGGHVFVGSTHAAEVTQALAMNDITYTLYSLVDMESYRDIMPLADQSEGIVRVFVEDDSRPHKEREQRFIQVQRILGEELRKIIGVKLEPDRSDVIFKDVKAQQAEFKRLKKFIMIMDMNTSLIKAFPSYLAQLRGRIGFCIISSENEHDQEIKELFGSSLMDMDGRKSLNANTMKIYGSGPKHHKELSDAYGLSVHFANQAHVNQKGSASSYELYRVDTHGLAEVSDRGIAFDWERAVEVDLSR